MKKSEQVLELAKNGPINLRAVSDALNISPVYASVILGRMAKRGELVRSGVEKKYTYTIAEQDAAEKAATAAEMATA